VDDYQEKKTMFSFNLTKPELIIAIIVLIVRYIGGYQGIKEKEVKNAKIRKLKDQCNRYNPEYKCALMFKDYK